MKACYCCSTSTPKWCLVASLASLIVILFFFLSSSSSTSNVYMLQSQNLTHLNDQEEYSQSPPHLNQSAACSPPINFTITTANTETEISSEKASELQNQYSKPSHSHPIPIPLGYVESLKSSVTTDDEEANASAILEMKNCDIFNGKWVYDPDTSPMYDPTICDSFFSDTVSCRRHGRPDREYEKWRWEPKDCKIPRFNGKDLLERLRGKRVILVGDSINHSQWESLACLLYTCGVPVHQSRVQGWTFKSEAYNCSVEFHWANFLVELQINKTTGHKILKLDTIVPDARKWIGADVMVFNTGHWWLNPKRWDGFQYKNKMFKDIKLETAFRVAIKSWARWVEEYVDTSKTKVFFRGMSPAHFGKHWCYTQTMPIMDESYESNFGKSLKDIVEKTIAVMKTPVSYLNITKLTQYRIDAHSSLYKTADAKLLIANKQQRPEMLADCSHWCLPGVPDTWNHLLYASMLMDGQTIMYKVSNQQ